MPVYAWSTPTIPPVQLNHIFGQFQIWDHTSISSINPFLPRSAIGQRFADSTLLPVLCYPCSKKIIQNFALGCVACVHQVSACIGDIWGPGEVYSGSSQLAWFTEKNAALGRKRLRQKTIKNHFFWKIEFLRRKVVFGYIGIVQKVKKIKKWARYWIQGISSRWLTLRLLGPAGHGQKGPLWPNTIPLELAWGSKRLA